MENDLKVIVLEDGKLTEKLISTVDPFSNALFTAECCPLFFKDENGNIELLEECNNG